MNIASPMIETNNLVVNRGNVNVLDIDHLVIYEGETLAVIGPNGAGKSTLLLTLSQLLAPTQGEITYRGTRLNSKDSLTFRRRNALVFQTPLLLSGSVFNNVATGLRFRKLPKKELSKIVDYWLSQFSISHLRNRSARRLSGGEAQRVSLARAFALNPEVIFLDEPFSALDTPTRAKLLEDLHELLKTSRKTAVFVTHDMAEALMLGNRVGVMLNGRLRQIGLPEQVFSSPVDSEVAHFVGIETIIPGKAIATENGLLQIQTSQGVLEVVGDLQAGREVLVYLRSEDITLWNHNQTTSTSARNRFTGKIIRLLPQGPLVKVTIDCGFQVTALITLTSARQMGLEPGQLVTAAFKASAAHLIPR